LPIMVPLDPAVKNAWGTIINNMMACIEQGGAGNAPISIAGLTTYSTSIANDATDQSRLKMLNFTGALAADCTVTIPAIARLGWVTNSTTGGHNVILTTGGGTTLTVPAGATVLWTCDATNVIAAQSGWQTIGVYTPSGSATQAFALPVGFKRFRVTLNGFTVNTSGAILGLQFSEDGGSTYHTTANYIYAS